MGSEKKRTREAEAEALETPKKKEKKTKKEKTPKKEKDENVSADTGDAAHPETEKLVYLSPISSPMADPKLAKKILKLVTKAAKAKALRRGIKEVAKAVRKQGKGLCVIAGDIFPIDVISGFPVALEEARIPYCYVPQKVDLGAAALTKRPTSIVLVSADKAADFKDELESCAAAVSKLPVLYKLS
ncbi:H/ACA ribonucleoprotein complex subunit 2-like protein [Porphyridium purpureum]|uniref:H/ACA ribonucleoprotein complex subunit 2 n=1 Tax=Porphyridium purpureum TaxID=35688 RepID=A0A5J4YSK0_PORPP|nr:H/ACA ribonucleoprotein complex subunit 2-like protein [Porphyridium purpureum]KAA8499416.1 H/ACA ribonucleoprotein complex subunit 2-like protein [Porphyridium purpureum]|eukprot:POR6072..scf295_1